MKLLDIYLQIIFPKIFCIQNNASLEIQMDLDNIYDYII